MSFFISDAVASAGQAAPEASFMSILPMLVILYFNFLFYDPTSSAKTY